MIWFRVCCGKCLVVAVSRASLERGAWYLSATSLASSSLELLPSPENKVIMSKQKSPPTYLNPIRVLEQCVIQHLLLLQNNFRYFPWFNLTIWPVRRRVVPIRIHPQVYATLPPNVQIREVFPAGIVLTDSEYVAWSRQVLVEPP